MYDEEKFANFNKMLVEAKENDIEVVVVATPTALGDDYEELIENLNRIADAGLVLSVVGRKKRHGRQN